MGIEIYQSVIPQLGWKSKYLLDCEEILKDDVIRREFEGFKFTQYDPLTYLKMLIVMVLYRESYRGTIELAATNIVVKRFLKVKEIPSKSSLHWFVHKFSDRIRDLLLKVFRRFESLVEEEQLPTHHLLAEEKFGRDIRLLDSFPVELPNGKKSIETHIEKLLLDLREIDSKRKPHEVLASLDEGKREELFSHFPRDYTVREHEGSWGRKWGKAWFGGKCFAEVSSKTLMVSKVELVLANVSDSRSPIVPNVVTLVDRGFVERGKVIRARKGLGVLRSGVEFFGIFLKEHMRCFARSLEVLNTFANLVGLAYNIQRFRALRKRRVLH